MKQSQDSGQSTSQSSNGINGDTLVECGRTHSDGSEFTDARPETCPPIEWLRQILTGTLADADAALLAEHIDQCADCQKTLDVLTRPADDLVSFNDTDPLAAFDLRPELPAQQDASLSNALNRLKQQGPPTEMVDVCVTEDASGASPVCFPGPCSEDAPLGTLNRYQVLEYVGSGASGHLYRAFDPQLGRVVAVKVLRSELALLESARIRLEREGRAVAQIDSEHIVQVHDVDLPDDFLPFMVMEFVDGESLREKLQQHGALSPDAAVDLVVSILSGLAGAHSSGIIHRDVKPSNILLSSSGRVKLVDFGLARLNDQPVALTAQGTIAGTPAYMSPEQIVDPTAVDARSDVYSAGVVLFELLTGEVPFRGVTRMVLHQVVHEDADSPRHLNDRVPRDLATICLKALAREPSRRYRSADEFAADLLRWQRGEAIHARPVGLSEKLWRSCRRNPVAATLCIAVGALLCGLAGVWADFTWSLSDSHRRLANTNSALRHSIERAQAGERAANANAVLAERQANLAFRLINQLVFDVQDQLDDDSRHGRLRQSLLKRAVAGLDELAGIVNEVHGPHVSLVVALNRLGDAYRDFGEPDAALREYTRALEIVKQLQRARSDDPRVQQCSVWTHLNLGNAFIHDDFLKAKSHYSTACTQARRLARNENADETLRHQASTNAATALRQLARMERAAADRTAALQHLRAAVAELDRVIRPGSAPGPLEMQQAGLLAEFADAALSDHMDTAREALRRACTIYRNALDAGPADSDVNGKLAAALLNLSELELRSANLDRASDYLNEGALLLEHAEQAGGGPAVVSAIALSENIRGRLAAADNDMDSARSHFERSVELIEDAELAGNEDPHTGRARLSSLFNLALLQHRHGSREQAEVRLRQLRDIVGERLHHSWYKHQDWLGEMLDRVEELLDDSTTESAVSLPSGR